MYIKANVNKIKSTRKILDFCMALDAAPILLILTGIRARPFIHIED